MVAWWWLLIVGWLGFMFGFFIFSIFKIKSDTDRMWEGYYQKLKEEKEKENGN